MAFRKGDKTWTEIAKQDADWMFVPPRSKFVIMTDRGDSSLWMLAFSTAEPSDDGLGYISIVQPIPDRPDQGNIQVYDAYDGPIIRWISTPEVHTQGTDLRPEVVAKLLIRDGYLGFERVESTTANARTLARKRVQRSARELIRPAVYKDSGQDNTLGWREMVF
jgi:hypothetical protein